MQRVARRLGGGGECADHRDREQIPGAVAAPSRLPQRWKRGPEGWFEPWIWLWQFMQPLFISRSSGALPVGMFCAVVSAAGMREVRVVDRRVTLLAQERQRRDEQLLVIRAVRLVAVQAALAHRRVLPQERAALLRVTAGAELIHVVAAQQRIGRRAVRVVTVDAGDLPLEQRHVRALAELGALRGVTAEAGLVRVLEPEQRLIRGLRHRVVAVAARQSAHLVRRAGPEDERARAMALRWHIAFICSGSCAEARVNETIVAGGRLLQVLAARAVTALAGAALELGARIRDERARVRGAIPVRRLDAVAAATQRVAHVLGGGRRRILRLGGRQRARERQHQGCCAQRLAESPAKIPSRTRCYATARERG